MAFELIGEIGTVQLCRRLPKIPDIVKFAAALSLGADNFFHGWQQPRAARKAKRESGVCSKPGYQDHLALEAYGPSRGSIEQAVANYLRAYPEKNWGTHFEREPIEIDGEWIMRGSRWQQEGWLS